MLALGRYRQDLRCPRCGGPAQVCQSADAEGAWRADPPTRCHVTTEILRAQEEHLSGPHSPQEQALVWSARPMG